MMVDLAIQEALVVAVVSLALLVAVVPLVDLVKALTVQVVDPAEASHKNQITFLNSNGTACPLLRSNVLATSEDQVVVDLTAAEIMAVQIAVVQIVHIPVIA